MEKDFQHALAVLRAQALREKQEIITVLNISDVFNPALARNFPTLRIALDAYCDCLEAADILSSMKRKE